MKQLYDPSQDPQFAHPFTNLDEWRERECADGITRRFRLIHGGFEGTTVKYAFFFPDEGQYEGRFFLHCSPFPGPDEELACLNGSGEGDPVGFAISHGACFAASNMGSAAVFGQTDDPTIFFRSNAAAAMQCRRVAQEIYGEHRMYGYVYGGSGGGFKTMSCIENTNQFDGAVPFVIGSPMSLPNCLTVNANGIRRLRHCWHRIVDNVEPGGSSNPYDGLNEEETAALRELLAMGFPVRMLITFANPQADGSLPVLAPVVRAMDPTYFEDFWTKPGYEGFEGTDGVRKDLTHMTARVVSVGVGQPEHRQGIDDRNGTDTAWQKMLAGGSGYIELTDVPASDYLVGIDMIFRTGDAAGKLLRLGSVEDKRVIPGMTYGADTAESVLSLLKPGDEVLLTNRDYIALQLYHRHQVPEDASFHAWDQYRGTALAQRPVIASGFTFGGCGSVQDGHVQGKVIVMNSLMDFDFPWQADWYFRKVQEVNGPAAADLIRIWYNDNCPHGDDAETDDNLHYTSYLGMLNQALLDVAGWVEKGVHPAPSTAYTLIDNQVTLAEEAAERGGAQPVVRLTVNGGECVRIRAGETVELAARIGLTEYSGMVEEIGWSFGNEQSFNPGDAETSHRYDQPGTYFPTVRVTTNRHPGDPYTKLRNLARARVIVE